MLLKTNYFYVWIENNAQIKLDAIFQFIVG